MSIFDLPGKVFSPKRKDNSSNLYTLGLWLRAVRLSPETYTLVSDGALSHLMREMGINLIVRLISGN